MRLDFAFLSEMRKEVDDHSQRFNLSLEEFDSFFYNFREAEGITEEESHDLIADFEVKLSKETQLPEDDELMPNINQDELDALKVEDYLQEEQSTEAVEDTDPEATLDYIIDGLIDSGKVKTLDSEERVKLFN